MNGQWAGKAQRKGQNVLELDLNGPVFYDKVYGCWLGKNAGGTLGTPLEKAFGEPEPFDVWWYPELAEGGLPNDDLEIQLAWLKALEEVGPGLTARDLARYWLDHVGYNFDEYGLSKTNLRLGLEPPVSGNHNNWFKDCMGCPIRSEIWACVAPAAPRVAAHYAYQDAICDHAGGESVYGELFNVAVESAGFVVDDRRKLIDIGLSYVPADSRTAAAINAAVTAHAEGLDWKAARRRVLEATPHYNAQYSPINLGFQVIGLLYGSDFGDGICKTVNCGYDTDSSGAAIGSYLGILAGRSGLPGKWIDPLGDTIATNESWGGVRHLSDGPNPIPANLDELVGRIRRVAVSVLTDRSLLDDGGRIAVSEADLYADESVTALWNLSPTRVAFPAPDVTVAVEYNGSPVAVPETVKDVTTVFTNNRPDPVDVDCALVVPSGWTAPAPQRVSIDGYGSASLPWRVQVPASGYVDNANRLYLTLAPGRRPVPQPVPVVLAGAVAVRFAGPFPADGRTDASLLETDFSPTDWRTAWAAGHALPLDGEFGRSGGVLYAQTFVHAPAAQEAWLVVDANCPAAHWVNGEFVKSADRYRGVRPNYGGSADSAGPVTLAAGWNEILVKLVCTQPGYTPECHVALASNDRFRDGQPHLGRTRVP